MQPGLVAELDAALAAILAATGRRRARCRRGRSTPTCSPTTSSSCRARTGRPRVSGLIDFYFACTDLLAYDLAVCLNAWCFEPDRSFNVTKAHAMLAAYAALRPLSEAERAALPVLCRGAALRFLLTRLYDWTATPAGALVTRKDPLEYLRKLRFFARAEGGADIGTLSLLAERSRSGPMAAASPTPAPAAGPRSCATARRSASSPAPTPPPPTTAWS